MKTDPFPLPRLRRTAAVLGAAAAILAGSVVFAARAGSGHIAFTATQVDVPLSGEFRKFAADVDFDPTKPEVGKVDLVIDLGSVSTGSTDADQLLKGADFFDVAQFPQATFVSQAITAADAGYFQARGALTLKGHSIGLLVPFSARPEGDDLRIEGSVPISRLAYQVGEGEWLDTGTLADRVEIRFDLRVPRER